MQEFDFSRDKRGRKHAKPKHRRAFKAWLLYELQCRGYRLSGRPSYADIHSALLQELRPRRQREVA